MELHAKAKSPDREVRNNCQPTAVAALGQDGMGNPCELLINVVRHDKPKWLIGLN